MTLNVESITPVTRRAILVCEGRCIRPTIHYYERSALENKGANNGGEFGVAFYFKCKPCGSERQYGFDGVKWLELEEEDDE